MLSTKIILARYWEFIILENQQTPEIPLRLPPEKVGIHLCLPLTHTSFVGGK